MEKTIAVLRVIVPIFTLVALGVLARRRHMMTEEYVQGMQRFVTKFCLPCVLFNSCLTATMEAEALTSMLMVIVSVFIGAVVSFRLRKKTFPYHNLPMLFAAQESGMLGIPLYLALFGSAHLFRMGVLDVAQAFVAIPVIALLSASTEEDTSVWEIVKSVVRSPLLLASLIGLVLNLSGALQVLNEVGVGFIVTDTTAALAQPVSAIMLFSVGYNFSLDRKNRAVIFRISAMRLALFTVFAVVMQVVLTMTGGVDVHTRWAMLLYGTLPSSFLTPGLGRRQEEAVVASGVCSLLTVVSLLVFCAVAILAA